MNHLFCRRKEKYHWLKVNDKWCFFKVHGVLGKIQVRIQDFVKGPQLLRPKVSKVVKQSPASGVSHLRLGSREGRTPRDPLDPLVKFAKNIRLVTAPALCIGDPHLSPKNSGSAIH